jgi:protein TonB
METLAHAPAGDDLDLLRYAGPPPDYALIRIAAIVSAAVHLLLIVWLGTVRFDPPVPDRDTRHVVRRITPLVDPPTQLTQKAPNRDKVTKQLNIGNVAPTPALRTPAPRPAPQAAQQAAPPTPRAAPRIMAPPPAPVQAERQTPKVQPMEPPKIDIATNAPPPSLPPPPPVEKPKLTFESPNQTGAPVTRAPNPALTSSNPVQDAMRNVARGGTSGSQRVSVADLPYSGPAIDLPVSPGANQPELELKSDAMGVDFKPYLIRVLATVRRNWFAVYPEAARLGMRGQVGVEFVVSKDGSIPKIAFSGQSGSRPLDEAAVAALSASNPLPPLPSEFKGQRVVLQFTFSYNLPKR